MSDIPSMVIMSFSSNFALSKFMSNNSKVKHLENKANKNLHEKVKKITLLKQIEINVDGIKLDKYHRP